MKKCSRCRKLKRVEEFNFKFLKLDIRQKACKECTRLEIRSHYQKNKEYYLHKARKRNGTIRDENREYVLTYLMTHRCVDCNEADPVVLEFDHIKDKVLNVAALIRNYTTKEIAEEITKCEVRCANCHRRKIAKKYGWYKNKAAPVA